jgi:hypothetical protein
VEFADWLEGTFNGAGLELGFPQRLDSAVRLTQGNDLLAVLKALFAVAAAKRGHRLDSRWQCREDDELTEAEAQELSGA